jgi:hypothetical protein
MLSTANSNMWLHQLSPGAFVARTTRVEVDVIDDLDGKPVDPDEVVQVEFSVKLPGARKAREYVLDLRPSNLTKFEAAIGKYISAATEVRGATNSTKTTATPAQGSAKQQLRAIREWARTQGYDVSDRGRIPAEIVDAYHAAH